MPRLPLGHATDSDSIDRLEQQLPILLPWEAGSLRNPSQQGQLKPLSSVGNRAPTVHLAGTVCKSEGIEPVHLLHGTFRPLKLLGF